MNWKPDADKDAAVKVWLKAKGWRVEDTEWDQRNGAYLWISHTGRSGRVVLGISRDVIDQLPAFAISEVLDRQNIAAEFRAGSGLAHVLVRRGDHFVLKEFTRE